MKCVEQYNCHNYQKCDVPRNESIARAVRQVQFVLKAGFPGALWCECLPQRKAGKTHREWWGVSRYIGNEDGAPQVKVCDSLIHFESFRVVSTSLLTSF